MHGLDAETRVNSLRECGEFSSLTEVEELIFALERIILSGTEIS